MYVFAPAYKSGSKKYRFQMKVNINTQIHMLIA